MADTGSWLDFSSIGNMFTKYVNWMGESNFNAMIGGALPGIIVGAASAALTGGNIGKGVLVGGLMGAGGGLIAKNTGMIENKILPTASTSTTQPSAAQAPTDMTAAGQSASVLGQSDVAKKVDELIKMNKDEKKSNVPAFLSLLGQGAYGAFNMKSQEDMAREAAKKREQELLLTDELARRRNRATVQRRSSLLPSVSLVPNQGGLIQTAQ